MVGGTGRGGDDQSLCLSVRPLSGSKLDWTSRAATFALARIAIIHSRRGFARAHKFRPRVSALANTAVTLRRAAASVRPLSYFSTVFPRRKFDIISASRTNLD